MKNKSIITAFFFLILANNSPAKELPILTKKSESMRQKSSTNEDRERTGRLADTQDNREMERRQRAPMPYDGKHDRDDERYMDLRPVPQERERSGRNAERMPPRTQNNKSIVPEVRSSKDKRLELPKRNNAQETGWGQKSNNRQNDHDVVRTQECFDVRNCEP